jgi:hypothetical protein
MLGITLTIKKEQIKGLILALMHGILALFGLISFFISLSNLCRSLFFSYLFIYSSCGVTQTILEHRIPRMNLFDQNYSKKIKLLIILLVIPVAAEIIMSIMWWTK